MVTSDWARHVPRRQHRLAYSHQNRSAKGRRRADILPTPRATQRLFLTLEAFHHEVIAQEPSNAANSEVRGDRKGQTPSQNDAWREHYARDEKRRTPTIRGSSEDPSGNHDSRNREQSAPAESYTVSGIRVRGGRMRGCGHDVCGITLPLVDGE